MAHRLKYIQATVAFAAPQEFARTNPDKILIGNAAIAAFAEVILDSCERTAAIGRPQATIG